MTKPLLQRVLCSLLFMCLVLLARNVSLLPRQFWPHKKTQKGAFALHVSKRELKSPPRELFYHDNQWWHDLRSSRCVQSDLRAGISHMKLEHRQLATNPISVWRWGSPVSLQKLLFAAQPPMMKLRGWYESDLRDPSFPRGSEEREFYSCEHSVCCLGLLREIWAHCEQQKGDEKAFR